MTTARKVLDWHGQGGDELAKDLERLPAGRYVLVPENELDEVAEADLSADEIAGLNAAIDARDGGDAGVSLDAFSARRAARATARRP